MITKTITIDEKKMHKDLLSRLEKTYTLAWVDYRDEVPAGLIQKCIDKKELYPLTDEDLWLDARDECAREILRRLLEEKYSEDGIRLFQTTSEYADLLDEIRYRDDSYPEKDAFENTRSYGYLRFHSNYDCWLPIWEQGGIQARGTALGGIMAALSLNPWMVKQAADRRGIQTFGPFRNIRSRNGKELVDYDAFIRVLVETPCYGNWSFFGAFDMRDLFNSRCNTDSLTIPKGTTAAMFNWWNGSGSLDFCETLRDVTVKELRRRLAPYYDDLRVVVDDKANKEYGYVPCDVYGGRVGTSIFLAA